MVSLDLLEILENFVVLAHREKAFKILKLSWHMFSKLQIETQNLETILSSKKYKAFLFAFCYHGTKTLVSQHCVLEKTWTVIHVWTFRILKKYTHKIYTPSHVPPPKSLWHLSILKIIFKNNIVLKNHPTNPQTNFFKNKYYHQRALWEWRFFYDFYLFNQINKNKAKYYHCVYT